MVFAGLFYVLKWKGIVKTEAELVAWANKLGLNKLAMKEELKRCGEAS